MIHTLCCFNLLISLENSIWSFGRNWYLVFLVYFPSCSGPLIFWVFDDCVIIWIISTRRWQITAVLGARMTLAACWRFGEIIKTVSWLSRSGVLYLNIVSSPQDDLCVDIWIYVMIILTHPDDKETARVQILTYERRIQKSRLVFRKMRKAWKRCQCEPRWNPPMRQYPRQECGQGPPSPSTLICFAGQQK